VRTASVGVSPRSVITAPSLRVALFVTARRPTVPTFTVVRGTFSVAAVYRDAVLGPVGD